MIYFVVNYIHFFVTNDNSLIACTTTLNSQKTCRTIDGLLVIPKNIKIVVCHTISNPRSVEFTQNIQCCCML